MTERRLKWFGFDDQVNGGRLPYKVDGAERINFSARRVDGRPGITLEQCCAFVQRMRDIGVRAFFPTLVTMDMETLCANLKVLKSVIETREGLHIPGLHIEACLFQKLGQYTGAHPPQFCLNSVSVDFYRQLQEAAGGHIKLMTVGWIPGVMSVIRAAVKDGVRVSLGHFGPIDHTDPQDVQCCIDFINNAVDAGATFATHVGNGCPTLQHRHLRPSLKLIQDPRIVPSIIADGSHLPPEYIKMVLAHKGSDVRITSDAAPEEGAELGTYSSWNEDVVVSPHQIKLDNGHILRTRRIGPKTDPNKLAASWETLVGCASFLVTLLRSWNFRVSPGVEITLEDLAQMTCDRALGRFGLKAADFENLPGKTLNMNDF